MSDLKALIEGDTNIPPRTQMLYLNGELLESQNAYDRTLTSLGIADGDMLSMTSWTTATDRRGPHERLSQNAEAGETLRRQALGSPNILQQIRQTRPELADAVNDPRRFRNEYTTLLGEQEAIQRRRREMLANLERDPFSEEGIAAQRELEEHIKETNIQLNITHALENNPEGGTRSSRRKAPMANVFT